MRTIEHLRRSGIGVEQSRTIRDAAMIMELAGVGSLAVLDGDRLVGIVTDRDLVRRGLARDLPSDARVDSVMTTPVATIDADADLHDAYSVFHYHDVRRVAVVRGEQFVGMISVDDLLVDLAADLADLSRPVLSELEHAHRDLPLPATQ